MFRLRARIDSIARTRNGQPPQSTTGVASTSSAIDRMPAGKRPVIAITTSGAVSAADTRKRRVMSASSGFGSSAAVDGWRGSSAMPQKGQLPGLSERTSGCIGQVHWAAAGGGGRSRIEDEDEDEDRG